MIYTIYRVWQNKNTLYIEINSMSTKIKMPKSYIKTIKIQLPTYYDLFMTCHSHGWKNLSPFSWNQDDQSLSFAAFARELPVDVIVRQTPTHLKADLISNSRLTKDHVAELYQAVTRSLSINSDTEPLRVKAEKVCSDFAELVSKGAGRLLRAPTLWEDAAKTLFTTNCSWALTKKMCQAMCSSTFSDPAPSGVCPFPPPGRILSYPPEKIRENAPVGYRARYLLSLAVRFHDDPLFGNLESNGHAYKDADGLVRGLAGFGDYAVAHLLVMAGYFHEIPIDTVVVSYLKTNHRVRKPVSFVEREYRKWGEYKWWGLKLEKIIRKQNWLGD